MRQDTRFLLLVFAGTALAMMLDGHGPVGGRLYPPHGSLAQPSGGQTAVLFAGTLAQAVGFGVAVALAANARRLVAALGRALPGRRGLAIASFAALLWILASWVPHVSLHQAIDPADVWALAAIEWCFHVSVVAAACVVARYAHALAAAPDASKPQTPRSATA